MPDPITLKASCFFTFLQKKETLVSIGVALLIIGAVGAYLVYQNMQFPLGITALVISGTGEMGLLAYLFFKKNSSKPSRRIANPTRPIGPEASSIIGYPHQGPTNNQREEPPVFGQNNSTNNQVQVIPSTSTLQTDNARGRGIRPQGSSRNSGASANLSLIGSDAFTAKKMGIIQQCNFYHGFRSGLDDYVNKLIKIFKTLSYEEVTECFSLKTQRQHFQHPSLTEEYVIQPSLRNRLIQHFYQDPKWLQALFTAFDGDVKEMGNILAYTDGGWEQPKIGEETCQGKMFQVLREQNKLMSILKELEPIILSQTLANLKNEEFLMLLSLLFESSSNAVATADQIKKDEELKQEKLRWIVYKLVDNAWKATDSHWHSFKELNSEEIQRAWKQLEDALIVIKNHATQEKLIDLYSKIFDTMNENMPRWTLRHENDIVQKVITSALAKVEEIGVRLGLLSSENLYPTLKILWEEFTKKPWHYVGIITACFFLKYDIYLQGETTEENEKLYKKFARRLDPDYICFVVSERMTPWQLERLPDAWGRTALLEKGYQEFARIDKYSNALIALGILFKALPLDKQKEYFPGFTVGEDSFEHKPILIPAEGERISIEEITDDNAIEQ